MPAPTSKRPGERKFVVDSGAPMHMLSEKDSSSDELGTLRRSSNPTVVLTANGEAHTNEETQVHVHDLNLFVTMQLLEETLAVLSLGKTLRRPRIFLWGEHNLMQNDNFVPLVDPGLSGLSTSSGSNSSEASTSQDLSTRSPTQVRSDELAPRELCGSPSKKPTQK